MGPTLHPSPGTELTPTQLDQLITHAIRRGRCHNARRDQCDCECGGAMHKAGNIPLPPDAAAMIDAARARPSSGRTAGPRRPRKKPRGQHRLPL